MTYAAVRIDHGLLVMPRFCAGLMVVLVVAEMPLGLAGLFMLAIGGRYRPVELEWQDQQKQDQAEPPHEWLKKCWLTRANGTALRICASVYSKSGIRMMTGRGLAARAPNTRLHPGANPAATTETKRPACRREPRSARRGRRYSAVPHSAQNFAPGWAALPHWPHTTPASDLPHCGQNWAR